MGKKIIIVVGLVLTVLLFVDVSGNKFRQRIRQDEQRVLTAAKPERKRAELKDVKLPEPVLRYFTYALRNMQGPVTSVRLKQSGQFRLKEADNWVPFEAVEHLIATEPAFVWHARLQPLPYVWTEARDLLYAGSGDTVNRLFAAVPLSFSAGREIDVSGMARFLAEALWIPTALLPGPGLEWQGINAHSARAVLHGYGYRVSAVFTFNRTGEIIKITTEDRYRIDGGKRERHPWAAYYRNYQTVHGMKIPTEIETEWTIDGRPFSNARFKVMDIKYPAEAGK